MYRYIDDIYLRSVSLARVRCDTFIRSIRSTGSQIYRVPTWFLSFSQTLKSKIGSCPVRNTYDDNNDR